MRQALTQQHPAVVLRSTYKQLRALLAIAMVAVVGLTVAVVILANEDSGTSKSTSSAASTATLRPDGGPEESGVAAAVGKSAERYVPMPRALPDGTTYVPGESAQFDGRPDESRIAGQIETSVQPQTGVQPQTQPKLFSGPRFGQPTD